MKNPGRNTYYFYRDSAIKSFNFILLIMPRRPKNFTLPTLPTGIYDLNGEPAYAVNGLYAITQSGKLYSYITHKYIKGHSYLNQGIKFILSDINCNVSCVLLHRLIAHYFIANPYNLSVVEHINGDKFDNRIENLRWTTRRLIQGKCGPRVNSPFQRKGISQLPNGRFAVQIAGKYLGCFRSIEVASLAYNGYAEKIGFISLNPVNLP